MTPETLLALTALAVSTCFTPGPNNTLLAASGANFGLRRTLPHFWGVALGFPLMLVLVGLLLGGLFKAVPLLATGLKWGGAALLVWMAWQIATSGGIKTRAAGTRPMSFLEGAAFQWVNPKGWMMAIAATAQFVTPERPVLTAALVALVFLVVGTGSGLTWVGAGTAIARFLTTQSRLRAFNLVMAALLVLSVAQMLFG